MYDSVDARVTRLPLSAIKPCDNKDTVRKVLASSGSGGGSGGSCCPPADRVLTLDSREANAVSERYVC